MAVFGTKAKCRLRRTMSEFGGEPENIHSDRVFRILTPNGHQPKRTASYSRIGPAFPWAAGGLACFDS
jgi:hypothetical protein